MEDPSQLAERILDQIADSVIYADRSGAIIRWTFAIVKGPEGEGPV
jgi:hypothetical protein